MARPRRETNTQQSRQQANDTTTNAEQENQTNEPIANNANLNQADESIANNANQNPAVVPETSSFNFIQAPAPFTNFMNANQSSDINQNTQSQPIHWLQQEIDLSKHNSGLKLIPEFNGRNWDEFKRKVETQFSLIGIDSFLRYPPTSGNAIDYRNDKITTAQISMRLPQAQYKQISSCSSTSEIWTTLNEVYEQTAESKAEILYLQFTHAKKQPNQSMKAYLEKLVELSHDLRVLKIDINEMALCFKALDGLSDQYRQVKAVARASHITSISRLTNLLISTELDESRATNNSNLDLNSLNSETQVWNTRMNLHRPARHYHRFDNRNRNNPNPVNRNNSYNGNSKSYNSNRYCTRCNRSTHSNKECWLLHPHLKQQNKFNTPTNNSATENRTNVDQEFTGFHTSSNSPVTKSAYLVDSGANVSMTNNQNILHDQRPIQNPVMITCSNGQSSPAYGRGSLRIESKPPVIIPDVLFVPGITKTLLATKSFTDQGLTIVISDTLRIRDRKGNTIITAQEHNGLHYLVKDLITEANTSISMELAHRRFGHASDERVKHLPESVDGIHINSKERRFCESCAHGKSRKQPFPQFRKTHANSPFEIVSSDLKGPFLVPSKEGYRYFITFNYQFSTWTWIKFLKHKSAEEVLNAIKTFITDAQAETKLRLRIFQTDNGSEYVNSQTSTFLLQKNIKHQRTVPNCPQQNGQAERRNQTIMNMARCALIEAKLPYTYWPFAVSYATYTLNRLPTRRIEWKTPYEKWTGVKPNVKHLRLFGCTAYAHIEASTRNSLQTTSIKCKFLGYAPYQKGYILQRFTDNMIIVRRDVQFDEQSILEIPNTGPEINEEPDPLHVMEDHDFDLNMHHTAGNNEPRSFEEAMNTPEATQWKEAALEEIKSHHDNDTWSLVDLPKGPKSIKSRWIFTRKLTTDGQMRYKARFVAKGFSQRYGIDYDDTYASVLAHTSLRLLVCIAVNKNWIIHQKDFKTAYLNAPLLTLIYIEQPEGFVEQGSESTKVCLLNKALYGLKQAGRAWQHSLFDIIKSQSYQQSIKEPCIWYKTENKKLTILGIYVDDILITGEDEREISNISDALANAFKMKHMGELKEFLGIEAIYKNNGITLSQRKYTEQIVKQFAQENCKPTTTPMSKSYEPMENYEINNRYPIRQAIGCLMYLANATRPDIAFSVNNVSRYVTMPTKELWKAIQRIIKYLKTTSTVGLHYTKSNFEITGWADSDYANDVNDRKSTTGWVFKLGTNTISWKSKKQHSVSLSTTEAEYMAASDASKEAIWIQDLLEELSLNQKNTALLFQDNQGAIFLEKNKTNKPRTKHIDIRHHFIREQVDKGRIDIQYCPTNDMVADLLTKPLPDQAFRRHRLSFTLDDNSQTSDTTTDRNFLGSVSEGKC